MALSIKSGEADRLAREVAARTGEGLTEAIVVALRERLERLQVQGAVPMHARLARLQDDVAALPVVDPRPPEELVGYDRFGAPR